MPFFSLKVRLLKEPSCVCAQTMDYPLPQPSSSDRRYQDAVCAPLLVRDDLVVKAGARRAVRLCACMRIYFLCPAVPFSGLKESEAAERWDHTLAHDPTTLDLEG